MSLEADFAAAPIVKWMGAKLKFDGESAVVIVPARPEHIQAAGVVHGSILTFAADTAAWFTAARAAHKPVTTATFTLNLLRPTKLGLTGRGILVKAGKRLVTVRSEVRDESGELVAEGSFTHAVL